MGERGGERVGEGGREEEWKKGECGMHNLHIHCHRGSASLELELRMDQRTL